MKTEYMMLLSAIAAWLVRGCFSAYRQRASLTAMQALGVVIGVQPNLAGGPPPEK